MPAATALVALLQLAVAQLTGRHTLTVAGFWLLLVTLVALDARSRIDARSRSGPAAPPPRRVLPSAVALWCMLSFALFLGYRTPEAGATVDSAWPALATALVGMAYVLLLVRYYGATEPKELPEARFLAAWFRAALWCLGIVAGLLVGDALGWWSDDSIAVRLMVAVSLLPGIEWLVRSLSRDGDVASLVTDVALISLHFQQASPLGSLLDELQHIFGVDLRSTSALRAARRAVRPLLVTIALIGWSSSGVVTVRAHEAAIVERFGQPRTALGPGLHLKAPWPIDRVHRVPVRRIRAIALGYVGPIAGSSQVWTKQHAQEEHSLLLGDGRELLAVNAELHYRVSDPSAWHYGTQNPEHALEAVAEQALLRNTVGRSLEEVLSEHTTEFARRVEADVHRAASARGLGVTVVSFTLRGLHPPVDVATDYQSVVSAQHEREAAVLNAAAQQIEAAQVARSSAVATTSQAKRFGLQRLARARGEASGFAALQEAYAGAPALFRFRRRLEALELGLAGTHLDVIDVGIERDGGALWLTE